MDPLCTINLVANTVGAHTRNRTATLFCPLYIRVRPCLPRAPSMAVPEITPRAIQCSFGIIRVGGFEWTMRVRSCTGVQTSVANIHFFRYVGAYPCIELIRAPPLAVPGFTPLAIQRSFDTIWVSVFQRCIVARSYTWSHTSIANSLKMCIRTQLCV